MVDLFVGDADDDEVADGELGVADPVVDEGDRPARWFAGPGRRRAA